MDFFRRWQQTSSYPRRPSPLATSQEPHPDPPRPYATSVSASASSSSDVHSRPEPDPTRFQYSSPTPTAPSVSSAQTYLSLHSPPSNTHRLPPHRRDGSLDTQDRTQSHRRIHSQPQDLRSSEDAGLYSGSSRDMNHQPSQPNHPPRRTSQGSSGSPIFPGPHEHSAPPAFGNRQMPPPSPPHSYSSRAQSANVPPTAPFPSREPPAGPSQRPGSSMSISSMLGGASERPVRDPAPSLFSRPSSLFGNPPPSSASAVMSPPTAPARPSPLDHSFFRRSHTPEKSFSKPQTGRGYRSDSVGGSHLVGIEQSKFGGLSRAPPGSQYPDKPHSTHPSPQIPAAEPPYNEPRRMSFSGPIARPSSQPPQAEGPTRTPSYSPLSRPTGGLPDRPLDSGQRSASASYMGLDAHHGRFGGLFGDRRSEDILHRDRDRVTGPGTDAKGYQPASSRYGSHYGDRDDRLSSASTWEQGRSYPPSPESKRFSAAEPGSGFGFGAIQSYTKSLGSQPGGTRQPAPSLQTRPSQPTSPPHESPFNKNALQPPRVGAIPAAGSSVGPPSFGLSSASEDGRRKGSDELLQHRSLLAVGADGKRGGRASPLPQAVQGAQAPFIGPAGEAGIKNELGRVFSGIGSGVGGVTASSTGSGPPTPLTSSPFKRDSFTGRSANGETVDEFKINRPPSATDARRSRKSRDEDSQLEMDPGDPRAGLSARGGRRARHLHHHHHHHHHHRQKAEEDAAALGGLHLPLSSTNFLHRTSTPADGAAGSGTAVGHHHHHHHHHHHAPRPAAATSPMREPRTVVNLEPLLSSVAHLPRHHLGSTLYNPRIGVPSAKASLDSAKFGYTTTPQPLPRFAKRENCTFTVRVPRFRIEASHREEICARRALWGTGVYTDDSDPVAAAIHSGYIRGAWGEDVDESMLDLEIKDGYQHAPQPVPDAATTADAAKTDAQAGEQPRLPPVPPRDRDLHITLLILPRLERYDSTVMFGLKSRVWDGRHDGMSFKVHRVDWVDEGVGRGEERGGEARRKRLRTLMQTGRICTGPATIKMDEFRRNGVQVPRTMDGPDQPAAVQPVS